MWGVSPAWYISKYGFNFGPAEIVRDFPEIAESGFDTVQLELPVADRISSWEHGGIDQVVDEMKSSGVSSEVFVAHCLHEAFVDSRGLENFEYEEAAKKITGIIAKLPGITTAVIPVPGFSEEIAIPKLHQLFVEQWKRISFPFLNAGLNLCVEVMPIGSDFLHLKQLLHDPDSPNIGINLDTGNFTMLEVDLLTLIRQHGKRIYATHLCDSNGSENNSLPPGTGTVPWTDVMRTLQNEGYSGSFDLEIICAPDTVGLTYRRALSFLQGIFYRSAETIPR